MSVEDRKFVLSALKTWLLLGFTILCEVKYFEMTS